MKTNIFVCLIFGYAKAAVEFLTKNEQVRYYFHDDDLVSFEYWVPDKNLEGIEWIGIGFQLVEYTDDEFKADVYFGSKLQPLLDGFIDQRSSSVESDISLGGTSDITSSLSLQPPYTIYIITRNLTSLDPYDTSLQKSSPIMIKTFKSPDKSSFTLSNSETKHEFLILNDYYLDRNDDEQGSYGPFSNTQVPSPTLLDNRI